MKLLYNILIVILISIFVIGCCTTPDIIINESDAPYLIETAGAFVSKSDMIRLANGKEIPFENKYKKRMYLPAKYIEIIVRDNKKYIKLRGK